MNDVFIRVVIGFLAGWFIGFMMTRTALKNKCNSEVKGILHLAYDKDDPSHPAMGLEIETLEYIMTHDRVVLTVHKIGFPSYDNPVTLRSHKDDKSA